MQNPIHAEYQNLLLENLVLNKVKTQLFRHQYIKGRLLEIERYKLTAKEIIDLTKETFKER